MSDDMNKLVEMAQRTELRLMREDDLRAEVERLREQRTAWQAEREGFANLLLTKDAEVERLRKDGTPGVMHAVDRAFYDITVQQRNAAWAEAERLRERVRVLELREHLRQNPPQPPQGFVPANGEDR